MNGRIAAMSSAAIILGMFMAGAWAVADLPAGLALPTHYGLDGTANRWAPAPVALAILPAIGTLMWAMWVVLPKVTPRGRNLDKSPVAYGTIWLAGIVLLAAFQGNMIAAAFGHQLNNASLMTAFCGVFFIVVGNVMGKLRWNYVVGIRTPWTLADERVWDKTHRFAGWLMVVGGVVLAAGAFVPANTFPRPYLIVGVAALIALATLVKSFLLWRVMQRQGGR